jgi:predicted Fe-S protein YdhL (DUF1289 family)
LTEAMVPGPCQVRINAESPCPRRAVVEILSVGFCEPCARQQEIYFSIGELTDEEETHVLRGGAVAEALKMMRRERAGVKETMAAELHHRLAGVREPIPIAPTNS